MDKNVNKPFRSIGATTYLSPVPVVMLGCADPDNNIKPNLITIAWAGIVNSKPPMISVSIRKERYSHAIISRTGEFTVNLTSEALCEATDYCGVKSGRDVDKFAQMGLTPIAAPGLKAAPAVAQAPAFLSCKVRDIIELGSHDLFLAEVIDVCVAEEYFTESGAINEEAMKLVGYVHGKYRGLSDVLGFFGYSIASDEALRRRGMKR
ncbi:MAG: flavin reductase family protein [Clostridiales bacterium]|nr:flavin reductase family protein [Clostridiales bacterium]